MNQLAALPSVSDHSTGPGALLAIQARAFFKKAFAHFVAFQPHDDYRALVWMRANLRAPERCACRRPSCAVDQHLADMRALENIPGPEADLQHWLAWQAYRITNRSCMGDDNSACVVLS